VGSGEFPLVGDDFEAPGPGQWALDRSHYPEATTPISQWLICSSMASGTGQVFGELGAPVKCIRPAFVNGFMYTRVVPLIGGAKPPKRLPPTFVLKAVSRIHPEFRRRAAQAALTLRDMPSLEVARTWATETRPRLMAENERLQRTDLATLDDAALEAHVSELLDHARDHFELHFWLHGHDLGPIAQLLQACEEWGISGVDAAAALAGASPTTVEPLRVLCRLRELVERAGGPVASLDDVRAVCPEAAELLDEYLDRRGNLLATGYDITDSTLAELPGVVLDSIRTATMPHTSTDSTDALRSQVPEADRATFDRYLDQARRVMDMRDDNGPLTAEWPAGLVRRALLECGRRLADRGAIDQAVHVLELEPDEARRCLTGGRPAADELARRRRRRMELGQLDPPLTIGPAEPEPPLDVLPGDLPQLVAMVQTAIRHLGMDGHVTNEPLTGIGIGRTSYTGRARRAASADEAIEQLEPGDVLVVRATSPAFNAVLTIAGAVVTADGGAMSHAAVLARELGIPAIIGARGALDIPDGSTVEVDPVAGRVRIV
jgi:phosphohistidine swiveling domain-containing protein